MTVSELRPAATPARLRLAGRARDLSAADRRTLLDRAAVDDAAVRDLVARIIAGVRDRGDQALLELASRFDGVSLASLEVPKAAMAEAVAQAPAALVRAMERAARNIATVHAAGAPVSVEVSPERGIVVGRRPDPLDRVGVYAPGGRATYPSSVLMGAIPARIAGVNEIILCSPPDASALPPAPILVAAAIAGVDRVFAVGGAGAIAAMALGTASVPRVDRIVGPGNAYVAEAKLQLVSRVAIDSPAGPSELIVIADDSADPKAVAVELVAQAEHDPRAVAVALAIGDRLADDVRREVLLTASVAARGDIVAESLRTRGGVLSCVSVDEAIAFANDFAPEHLMLMIRDADAAFARVRNAGTVFLGATTSVAFGDYMTGANHVLPTGGLARAYSGLSPLDFVRWTTYQRVRDEAARSLADDVALFANAEGLPGHALAARRGGVT